MQPFLKQNLEDVKSHCPAMNIITKSTIIRFISVILILATTGCQDEKDHPDEVMTGKYWNDQALRDILPYWTEHARDTVYGGFLTNLDAEWLPSLDFLKYPSMIGRHLFSYSVAYLLTGDDHFLKYASQTRDYLIKYAWDNEYGGWFDNLNRDGTPAAMTKNMFIQTYAVTGLAMYYFITHDPEVLAYIEKTNTLIETNAWDKSSGGYFDMVSRDWTIPDGNKSFASQVAPVSGYLLYLYLATSDETYLSQAQRLMDVVISRMTDTESGWVLESFDKDWNYIPGNPDEINIGHNLEVAWMLMRICRLTDNPKYLRFVKKIGKNLNKWGFENEKGFWYNSVHRLNPEKHTGYTYWWIQAYGNMFDLSMFQIFKDPGYLRDFKKGAGYWDAHFLDRKYGDTFFSVFTSGEVRDSVKANPFKTSYHSMEHCLLNLTALNFWVNHEPVKLHFSIHAGAKGDTLHPVPVEDRNIHIHSAFYTDENKELIVNDAEQAVFLPDSGNLKITVILENSQDKGAGK